METRGKTLNDMCFEQAPTGKPVEFYSAPQVEVIDIELTQNILQGSTQKSFGLPTYEDDGDAW